MRHGFRNFALVLMLVASAAWSASARVYVECADGTACPAPPAPAPTHRCCTDSPGHHPIPAPHAPCVLRVMAAPDSVTSPSPVDLSHLPPAAVVATPLSIELDVVRVGTVVPIDRRPPPQISVQQGRGPRAPPLRPA